MYMCYFNACVQVCETILFTITLLFLTCQYVLPLLCCFGPKLLNFRNHFAHSVHVREINVNTLQFALYKHIYYCSDLQWHYILYMLPINTNYEQYKSQLKLMYLHVIIMYRPLRLIIFLLQTSWSFYIPILMQLYPLQVSFSIKIKQLLVLVIMNVVCLAGLEMIQVSKNKQYRTALHHLMKWYIH